MGPRSPRAISGAYNDSCVEPLLESDAGPVRGACCDGLAVFGGVPYAERSAWNALQGDAS
jgi:hypothetical protein